MHFQCVRFIKYPIFTLIFYNFFYHRKNVLVMWLMNIYYKYIYAILFNISMYFRYCFYI